MNFERFEGQKTGESIFGASNVMDWKKVKAKDIKGKVLNQVEARKLKEALLVDSKGFYYKGVISLGEAIFSISRRQYSWATVKLYYSLFYMLRASLACNGYGFLRNFRDLYYYNAKENEKFLIPEDKTDHKGTIKLFIKIYAFDDKLQTNNINGENPYLWLMEKREMINYKSNTFVEPGIPDFWNEINESIKDDNLNRWLNRYIYDKSFIYCFLEEHACLALPLKRLLLTQKDMIAACQSTILSTDQQEYIKKILPSRRKKKDLDFLKLLIV
ncbi:hypothetical protein [Paenibacillus sp. HB172176]|uniref:hypothetical protein n=1 Tax=Paenibacillus sp. HB172176 TaxID=2493690 RepID=UPI00143AC1D0|nr:hypothetical protein [Paenibacillus sp. HB172176]